MRTDSVRGALEFAKEMVREYPGGIPLAMILYEWPDLEREFLKTSLQNQRFLEHEIKDWIRGDQHNPGSAWLHDKARWAPYLNKEGTFDYRYPERMRHLTRVINELNQNPNSRKVYLSIWDKSLDLIGEWEQTVPCVLGFHFYIYENCLHMTVVMRSLDVEFCLFNDLWLSIKLLEYVSRKLDRVFQPKLRLAIIASHCHKNGGRGI